MINPELKQQIENLLGSANSDDVTVAENIKALIASYEARELSKNELLEGLSKLSVPAESMANTAFQRLVNTIS